MSKLDNRYDSAKKIQKHIDNTLQNIEFAEDMIAGTTDEKIKIELTEKNKRREESLKGFKSEMKEEAAKRKLNE